MALQNRKTVMALVKETAEGTPVAPTSAADDYIALQDGFSMEPAFSELENAELTGSIGQAKSILGFEEPSASVSHYLKHSGVEGVRPNFGLILECLLGAEVIEAIEYNTVAGSTAGDATTRGTVVVDVGEGAQFERGQAVLKKDATNGYSVSNVFDVSTDTLNLLFNHSAPASGVNLGKAVMYKMADEGHPTMAAWLYRANGGAVELMSGVRPVDMTLEATAGELINASFSMEGVEYFFNPMDTAGNFYLDFTDDVGVHSAQVEDKFYKDPHELAAALQVAADGVTTETIKVVFDDSLGKFVISSSTSTIFVLDWSTGANSVNSIGSLLGFVVVADDTGATSYTADNELSYAAPQTPSYDSTSPIVAKSNEVLFGDFDDNVCFEASSVSVSVSNTKSDLLSMCADSGKAGSLITERDVSVDLVARLEKHDADKFRKFRSNDNVQFQWNFGAKSGGNWVAGKTCNVAMPTATIVSYSLQDTDGVIELAMSLSAYVADGAGEFYINFL